MQMEMEVGNVGFLGVVKTRVTEEGPLKTATRNNKNCNPNMT